MGRVITGRLGSLSFSNSELSPDDPLLDGMTAADKARFIGESGWTPMPLSFSELERPALLDLRDDYVKSGIPVPAELMDAMSGST